MFDSLIIQVVATHAVKTKGKTQALAGDDSRDAVWANSLQRHQCDILLEGLCELDDARHVLAIVGEVVAAQTAIGGTKPLGGGDSWGWV